MEEVLIINSELKHTFLSLVRLGIGHHGDVISHPVDWHAIKALAEKQGLSAIILDGIEKLSEENRPPTELLMQWIGDCLQNYDGVYEQYKRAIAGLAGFYNAHGYKMMVLKGYACSLDWPKPAHRPCGDIDIWLFGRQKEADKSLQLAQGPKFEIDKSHHHHTVFEWQGVHVENHYDFINVHTHRSSRELEKVFKELGQDDSHDVELYGEKVYLPSPNLHALFLIRHMASHFAAAEITLRQVLDWAFFVEKHTAEVDWKWLTGLLEKYHLIDFFNCIYGVCVEELGFSPSIFPPVQFSPDLKDKVLNDIFSPEYTLETPKGTFDRLIYKYRRWQGNAWKQRMCYDESRWSAFCYGVWAKMLKPGGI